jgi:hypothetical protein
MLLAPQRLRHVTEGWNGRNGSKANISVKAGERLRLSLSEYRKVERLTLAKPDHVVRVVGEVVAGIRMGEDRELAAVEDQPLRDLSELLGRNGQLAAAARVRPDWTKMVMSFGHAELGVRGSPERPGGLDLIGIEIDVGVKVSDHRP